MTDPIGKRFLRGLSIGQRLAVTGQRGQLDPLADPALLAPDDLLLDTIDVVGRHGGVGIGWRARRTAQHTDGRYGAIVQHDGINWRVDATVELAVTAVTIQR